MAEKLERLTETTVRRAETKGLAAGWYALCQLGYSPAEIAIYCKAKFPTDVRQTVRDHAERHGLPIPATCARIREPAPPKEPPDWKEAFRDNVMRTGMILALSQPMLEYLCATADDVIWDRFGTSRLCQPNNSLACRASLVKRGLIRTRTTFPKGTTKLIELPMGTAFDELTEAGKCVVELLKVTGVFRQADRAIEKSASKVNGARRG